MGLRELDPILCLQKRKLIAFYNEKDKTHDTVLQNKKASDENVSVHVCVYTDVSL